MEKLADRVAALEERVAALEGSPPPEPAEGAFWALDGLKQRTDGAGAVLYTGTVGLPTGERYDWQYGTPVETLLGADWSALADRLAALGHPVRLRLLHRVLDGARSTAELAADDELGTTGQLYHHLRQLTAAGWLESSGRGRYAVPGDRVVPLLAILSGVRS
ncbi:ArsR/SmtB family transcription factor [Cryptosporangium phraense]|uniref:Helix-turn-helix transcriptional regulator n=1 Tax=Cryptosporangium phraense TaxID=2593070 RepID=A0A545AL97_9ACTN|nr:helix-turn-helix domain-containing protein [Cryptosporangium phraense]TQS42086.1 helix-turn-helix transcriptional regulator [Cryptosporangium phraense]